MTPSSFCTMQPHKGNVWWLNTAIRKNEWNGASPARQKAGSSWEWIAQDTAHKSFQRAPDTPSIPPLPKGLCAAATTQGGLEPPATIPARRGAGDTPGPPSPRGAETGTTPGLSPELAAHLNPNTSQPRALPQVGFAFSPLGIQ